MAQALNQLQQAPVQGELDLAPQTGMIGCCVKSDEATPLIPGQGVTLVDSADGVPKVTAVTSDTAVLFGFVPYTQKDQDFPANAAVDIAFYRGCIMYMTSNAAIARGAQVMVVVSGTKVATATTNKRIAGIALDKATDADQLIRVLIDLPGGLAA